MLGADRGWSRRDGQPPWRRGGEGGLGLVSCQCFLALPGSPWQCHLLKAAGQRGWGQPEPWTGGPRAVFGVILFYFFFCKSWCRLRVLEPSQVNGGGKAGGGQRRPGGFRVLCFPEGGECVCPPCPGSQAEGPAALEIHPTSPNVHRALGTPVLGWKGSRSRETGIGCSSRGSSESSERSHGMIKGKWRIDLGGKIKGAKSVALGSAVTKRGQDNSLQMCERCKYQTGGGEAAGGPGEQGGGLGSPQEGWRPLGDCPIQRAPLQWRC